MTGLFWLVAQSLYASCLLLAAVGVYVFLHVAVLRPSRSPSLPVNAVIRILFCRAIALGLLLALLAACLIGMLLREGVLTHESRILFAAVAGISAYRGWRRARRTWATAQDVLDFPANSTAAGRSFMSKYDYFFFLAIVLCWTLFRAAIGDDVALLIATGMSVALFPSFLVFSLTGFFRARALLSGGDSAPESIKSQPDR